MDNLHNYEISDMNDNLERILFLNCRQIKRFLSPISKQADCDACFTVSPCIFNSIMYKTPTYALFHSTLYYSSVLISLKYTKIFNSTPTCFDLKRSSSGSMTVPC